MLEAHIQTGHGGLDKMKFYSSYKLHISKSACSIFVSWCNKCNRKRAVPKADFVVKPTETDRFNIRTKVDLINFQSCPDNEFKFLMNTTTIQKNFAPNIIKNQRGK